MLIMTIIKCYFCSLKQQVTDIKGHTLVSHEDKSKGKFAFTTDDYEVYEICFMSKVPPSMYNLVPSCYLSLFLKWHFSSRP